MKPAHLTDTVRTVPRRARLEINAEIAAIETATSATGVEETQPRLDYAPYRSSLLRHPTKDLHHADPETRRTVGAVFR